MLRQNRYILGNFHGKVKTVVKVNYNLRHIGNSYLKIVCGRPVEELYDEFGNVLESLTYDATFHICSKVEFTYDDEGRQIKQTHYGQDGQVETVFVDIYDSNGSSIRVDVLDGKGNLIRCMETPHPASSDNDDEESETWINTDEVGSIGTFGDEWKSIKDESGRVVAKINTRNGSRHVLSKETYRYDSHGNIVETCQYGGPNHHLFAIEEKFYSYHDEIYDNDAEVTNEEELEPPF